MAAIPQAGGDYGRSARGEGVTVNIEYVSANPTGPMHMGHCRGAVVGDALATLLEFAGHKVIREYYVNDAGGQVDVLARSAAAAGTAAVSSLAIGRSAHAAGSDSIKIGLVGLGMIDGAWCLAPSARSG